jgi:hypothetical protein
MEGLMNEALNGKWSYRSFYHDPIMLKNGQVDGNPELAAPWAPPGVLQVDTDPAGTVTGILTFAPNVALKIAGRVISSAENIPTSVELVADGLSAIYKIKGFFIPGSDHVVGTVLNVANDLAKKPVGTVGPFVLIPAKA